MLNFGQKKNIKTHFLWEKNVFNQIFNRVIVRMWTVWCARLKNTQNVEIAKETEFLPISQKSHFPKIDYRFWKLNGTSIWDQKFAFFWTWSTRLYPAEQVQSILQPEISIHFAHFWF